jgi:hypothetical protein
MLLAAIHMQSIFCPFLGAITPFSFPHIIHCYSHLRAGLFPAPASGILAMTETPGKFAKRRKTGRLTGYPSILSFSEEVSRSIPRRLTALMSEVCASGHHLRVICVRQPFVNYY